MDENNVYITDEGERSNSEEILNEDVAVTTTDSDENVVISSDNSKNVGDPSQYKLIVDMIKEMDEQYNFLKNIVEENAKNEYHMKPEIVETLFAYTEGHIKEMSDNECSDFLGKYLTSGDVDTVVSAYQEDHADEFNSDDPNDNAVHRILLDLKKDSMTVMEAKAQADDLKKSSGDILNEYFNYMSSNKITEMRQKKLELLKSSIETETDEVKRHEIERMIDTMEKVNSLNFIFDRINSYGKKEIDRLVSVFFDNKKSSYVIKRYCEKIHRFGFQDKVYRYFFNLEENFLPEEYHVYNNFFLFVYMSFTAYANPDDEKESMYVRSITSSIANLIYHRSSDEESTLIHVIQSMCDIFKDYRDSFDKNNTTHPNHPTRIASQKKHEESRRNVLIKKMDELNITGYDEDASADKLQEYMNEKLDEIIKSQIKVKEETNTDTVFVNEEAVNDVTEDNVSELESDSEENTEEPIEVESVEVVDKDNECINLTMDSTGIIIDADIQFDDEKTLEE